MEGTIFYNSFILPVEHDPIAAHFLCNFTLCFVACTNVTICTFLLAFSLIKSTIYVSSGGQFFVNFLSIYVKAIFHCFNCNTYLYISWYVCVSLIRLVIKALQQQFTYCLCWLVYLPQVYVKGPQSNMCSCMSYSNHPLRLYFVIKQTRITM